MLDWEGEMIPHHKQQQVLLEEIPLDESLTASLQLMETDLLNDSHTIRDKRDDVLFCCDDAEFLERLLDQVDLGNFSMSAGATVVHVGTFLDSLTNNSKINATDENGAINELFKKSISGHLDLNLIMVSASEAGQTKDLDPNILSKLWKIEYDEAVRTLDVTSQQYLRNNNPKLARNYGTNDRMLCYKHINEYFFMDTFFATKKSKKSSRGHTCCQLFVTNRGFVYVVGIRSVTGFQTVC